MFSSKTNTRPLRSNEYRVWRFGESRVARSLDNARRYVQQAQRLDSDAHAVDANGERI